ncbi:DUF1007 family protein [Roseibacterium sp. SDUM158017]|uniref:DUF1007 family protein n=1 Tax=Roseicyclus salinarum TaxID=3036773 RepID=UPI0024157366|nr:DUF1007 family protein [Roseibacterium sp. SDUM158017]MDG4647601.1 DUF1007 family protein [Roseibacterium sp. SDUM158017]
MRKLRNTPILPALAALGALAAASPLASHPHIFIDAGVTLSLDEAGRIEAVEVTWRYDELYSLILLQDYGLDEDFDTNLTEAEIAATLGFDLNWNGGFEGGLHLFRGGAPLAIGAPEAVSLTLLPDGRLQTVHRRAVSGDPGGDVPAEARIYDADFYIAFEATLPSGVAGGDCAPELVRADLDAAYAALEAEIASIGGAVAAEDNFPPVGALFADSLVFSCGR